MKGLAAKRRAAMISVAVAACWAGCAHAQSSVTLYGELDAGLLYTNRTLNAQGGDAGKQFSLINSGYAPSRFGMSGKEDLGGGLFAKFQLESGISMVNGGFDNSNTNLFGRQAWISLASPYGEVKAGLQYSPYLEAAFDLDPRSFSQFGSAIVVYAGNSFNGIFDSNAISYTTPEIAGLSASVLMAMGGVPGNFVAGRQYSAILKYARGGLNIDAAILDASQSDVPAFNANPFTAPVEARIIGAGYSFSAVTVKASFANYKAPLTFSENVRSGGNNNVYNLGFAYHVLPYLDLTATAFYVDDRDDSSSHSVVAALGTQYFLSKHTSLYAQVGMVDNHGTENIGLSLDGLMHAPHGTTVGATMGMTHSF